MLVKYIQNLNKGCKYFAILDTFLMGKISMIPFIDENLASFPFSHSFYFSYFIQKLTKHSPLKRQDSVASSKLCRSQSCFAEYAHSVRYLLNAAIIINDLQV